MQDRLFDDPELVRFYDAENEWREDLSFCPDLAQSARSVLDLGCGTGLFAAAIGAGREVWGVDPARAMLDVARSRPGGALVTWVEGDGRQIRLGRRFDLIVLTGHAFQCMLTDADQLALCQTIAAHLAPEGRFVFDSRNPAREEWREWTPEQSRRTIEFAELGPVEAWNDVSFDHDLGVASYDTFYRSQDDSGGAKLWRATSRIRFASKDDIQHRLHDAGLFPNRWLGDWQGGPWNTGSKEIIPLGGLAPSFA